MWKTLFLCLMSAFLASQTVQAELRKARPLLITEALTQSDFGPEIDLYLDPDMSMDIKAVSAEAFESHWTRSKTAAPNLGYSNAAAWGRIHLDYQGVPGNAVVLYFATPQVDVLELYGLHNGEWVHDMAGDTLPISTRSYRYRYPNFLIHPKSGLNTYYIRLKGDSPLSFHPRVATPSFFYEMTVQELSIHYLYFGIIIAMMAYNLFLYISVRDNVYLFYILFQGSLALAIFGMNGFLYQTFFSNGAKASNIATSASLGCALALATVFSMTYLDVHKNYGKLKRLGVCIIAVNSVLCLLSLVSMSIAVKNLIYVAIVTALYCLFTGFYCLYQGNRAARFYTAAWSFILLGTIIVPLRHIGVLPLGLFTGYGLQLGSAAEGILLSLGLADRLNEFRRLKYLAQKRLLALSAAKDHSYNQLAKLIYPHQIKSIEMGGELENTMPTVPGEGVVLCFDIIGSSKLKHIRLKDFLASCIHDCLDLLQLNYDPDRMQANGYRIKEMGDGFLCSLDYPFATAEGTNCADLAFHLALMFIEKLEDNVLKFQFDRPIFCGVGIAMGQLQGYYTKTSPKDYDLFGRGIVLATRYEALRKELFSGSQTHSIIMHSGIFNSLSLGMKKELTRYDLNSGFRIRDDAEATEFYYAMIPFKADLGDIEIQAKVS